MAFRKEGRAGVLSKDPWCPGPPACVVRGCAEVGVPPAQSSARARRVSEAVVLPQSRRRATSCSSRGPKMIPASARKPKRRPKDDPC